MRYLWLIAGVAFLSGCLVRTYTTEKPRVDTEIEGNQGYLGGAPKEAKKVSRLGKTRKLSVMEIEVGLARPKKKAEEGAVSEKNAPILEEEIEAPLEEEAASAAYNFYTVQKNDTLQKISYKFYGTTKKWKMLYDVNKDVIKQPDKIYPGLTIKVPILE